MRNYVEQLRNLGIPENKGYQCVGLETIYTPLLKVDISIIKRKNIPLTLVEEIVLRIAQCGVNDIDEISDAMGLDRSIVAITLADLHIKDLAYTSANKCLITGKGRQALKVLSLLKRETDVIRNIYVTVASNTFSEEASSYMTTYYLKRSHLFESKQRADNIEYYRQNIGDIREIYSEVNTKTNAADVDDNSTIDELLSIEGIEIKQVNYMQIPLYLYVSDSGREYDIMPKEIRQRGVFSAMRDAVIAAINQGRLLSDIFCSTSPPTFIKPRNDFLLSQEWLSRMKTLGKDPSIHASNEIDELFFAYRKLLPGEIYVWFSYNVMHCKSVEIWVDDLDDWANDSTFITMLTSMPQKVSWILYYAKCNNYGRSQEAIHRAKADASKLNIFQQQHSYYFLLNIDKKLQIQGFKEAYSVADMQKHIITRGFYTERI